MVGGRWVGMVKKCRVYMHRVIIHILNNFMKASNAQRQHVVAISDTYQFVCGTKLFVTNIDAEVVFAMSF